MSYKISKELLGIRKNYDSTVTIVEGLQFRQRDVIRMIEFYGNSKYLNGQKDELGREKPFYNIGNAMCDVENAAKDIDTKDISITSDDGEHYVESFLMSKDIYEWMKTTNFAKTLNDMRDAHTRYGSLLVKKVTFKDDDGKKQIRIEQPEWKNTLTDQINILKGAIVEMHFMTATDLAAKIDVWETDEIKELIKKLAKSGFGKRIPVFEIRGEFPKSYINELEHEGEEDYHAKEDDDYEFSYQLYYLAGDPSMADGSIADKSVSKLKPLYWEDDTERVYKYLARKKKAGRDFGVGVVEEGEEAQVWTNDAVLKQYRAMEYTTKVIGQTASKKLKGRNMLTEVDDGQILEVEDKKPIAPVQLLPAGGLAQYQNLIVQWFTQAERASSTYAAQRGEAPPSGTPFRLQASILQQSGTVFQDLQEELGIFITEIFDEWILPFLAKQLNAEHILAHEFSMDELKEIDKNFSTHHANDMAKQLILSGQIVSVEQYEEFKKTALEVIGQTKGTRFLQIPKNFYKTMKAKTTVNVTGEQRNKAATLESLINILTVYAQNPQLAQDPVLTQIFMRIVELSGAGISPVSLMGAIAEQAQLIAQKKAEIMAQQDAQANAANPGNGAPAIAAPADMSLAATGANTEQ